MKHLPATLILVLSALSACQPAESTIHIVGLDVSGSFSEEQRSQTLSQLGMYVRKDLGHVADGDQLVLVPIHAATSSAGAVVIRLGSSHKGRRGQNELESLRTSVISAADSLMRLDYGTAAHGTDLISFFSRIREWSAPSGRILVFSDMVHCGKGMDFESQDPTSMKASLQDGALNGYVVRVILPASARGTGIKPELARRLNTFWTGYIESAGSKLISWGTNL